MKKMTRRFRTVGMLAAGATLLQFGGCGLGNLGGIWRQAGIGFAYELGAIPARVVYDAYIAPLVEGLLPGNDTGDGTTDGV
jgi:hypothetical protein